MSEMERIISENIKTLLRKYNVTQSDLSKIAGVSESTVGKWILQKSTPRMGAVQKIADHFKLPKSYILNEKQPENLYEINKEFSYVPVLGTIACGDPIYVEENFEEYRTEPKQNLPIGNLYYLRAKGDSMEPTIPSGSIVLIREQNDVELNEIAAVLVNGDTEATLKRISKQNGTVFLMPDNPKHHPIIVDESNPAKIIGKAIRYTQDL
ncbi:LexA family protein [Lentibacillus cibarius]|uniref:Helix-turn-helix domain-containing protein n=1 Tax=Lentibacillus cibarius TaxID=2583219 RepID=A0A5S3R6T0_9BACI|nr:XRE family transcriptional regulator [Lentibacillus cibarius]TMN20953.1 helix-turn-helix domain-containing protein [Lentibacillus cibarius]